MSNLFYRFRSSSALLAGYHELERQEIFFSQPDHLNDPMEGFKNVVWAGDSILWKNLLRHYLFCLFRAATLMKLHGPDFTRDLCSNLVRETDEDFPHGTMRLVCARLWDDFFAHEAAQNFVEQAAALKLRLKREGLRNYLRFLQPIALNALFRTSAAHGVPIVVPSFDTEALPSGLTEQLNQMMVAHAQVGEDADVLLRVGELTTLQLDLINDVIGTVPADRVGPLFLVRDFPSFYADSLQKLMFPDWATACFVTNAEDPAMWGVYGDGHRGACLIFRSSEQPGGNQSLTLDWSVGLASRSRDVTTAHQVQSLPFTPVRYDNHYPEIDFFSSLGVLVRSKLTNFWYAGADGARSPVADVILSEMAEWRTAYWQNHGLATTTKLPQWEREREHRLVLTTNFVQHGDKDTNKLRYRFADLAGIAFGMRMAHADKLEIMRIIERKSRAEGRKDFEFYQADYESRTGSIALRRLGLIKFKG